MIIYNASIYTQDRGFVTGTIHIQGERIASIHIQEDGEGGLPADRAAEPSGKNSVTDQGDLTLDASELIAIPGLTDIHFHGCAGYDFCDGTNEAYDAITDYEAAHGITTICPATMTLPEETLAGICKTAAAYRNESGSKLAGIHMEGPYLSEKKKGAQNAAYLHKPDLAMYHRLNELSGGLFKIISIAPEEEGAMEFIAALKDQAVISLAHTTADYATSSEAFRKGAGHVTHLYNAMPPFHHRDPSVIGAAFDSPDATVELICDGIHLHPSVVRATFAMFGEDRVILVSDSMMATGLKDGIYSLGGQEVTVSGKTALLSDGTIAGSATNLMDCMIHAVKNMGIPLQSAIKAAAVNPARRIGIYEDYGSITVGKMANIVLLDKNLNMRNIILKGRIYQSLKYN